jgi:hypothetical protein
MSRAIGSRMEWMAGHLENASPLQGLSRASAGPVKSCCVASHALLAQWKSPKGRPSGPPRPSPEYRWTAPSHRGGPDQQRHSTRKRAQADPSDITLPPRKTNKKKHFSDPSTLSPGHGSPLLPTLEPHSTRTSLLHHIATRAANRARYKDRAVHRARHARTHRSLSLSLSDRAVAG